MPPSDYVELGEFARRLPELVTDRIRLLPLVTTISEEADRAFRAQLRTLD